MRAPRLIPSFNPLVVLAVSGLALAACASSAENPQTRELNAMYHVGQNNDFGAAQDAESLRAAAMPPSAPLTAEQRNTLDQEFNVGQNTAFGAEHSDDSLVAQREYNAMVAGTVPMVNGKRDLLGDGGAQDALARKMFPLGTSANNYW